MPVVSVVSTRGGGGKATVAANPGEFVADAGLHVRLLGLGVQPTRHGAMCWTPCMAEYRNTGVSPMRTAHESVPHAIPQRLPMMKSGLPPLYMACNVQTPTCLESSDHG